MLCCERVQTLSSAREMGDSARIATPKSPHEAKFPLEATGCPLRKPELSETSHHEWDLPVFHSPFDEKDDFDDLLNKLRRLYAKVSARNSLLESEAIGRITKESCAPKGCKMMPVPEEWASSSEVRNIIKQFPEFHQNAQANQVSDSSHALSTLLACPDSPHALSAQDANNPVSLVRQSTNSNHTEQKPDRIMQSTSERPSETSTKSRWRVTQGSTKDLSGFDLSKAKDTKHTGLRRLVNSKVFIGLCSAILISYAIFIAVETELLAQNGGKELDSLATIHIIYSIVFTVELLLRLGAAGRDFFLGSNSLFNWFDTALVVSTIMDFVLATSDLVTSVAAAGPSMRALRVIRVVRTMRLVRSFRYLHEFQKMTFALAASLKTLLCSALVVFFVMFFFTVVFTQSAADPEMRDTIPNLIRRYGSLSSTLYSLFASVSTGLAWDEAHAPLHAMGSWLGWAFILYIIISLFGVMNVVTSIFVESVIRSAQHHRDVIVNDKEKDKWVALGHMQEVFRQVDMDGSGLVTADELEHFLGEPELRVYMEALDLTTEDTRLLFRLLDRDSSHSIDIEEFCEGCLRLKGAARSIDMQTLMYQMKNFLYKWGEFTHYVEQRFDSLQTGIQK